LTRPSGLFDALYTRPLPWLMALALAHVVIRVTISPALQWDEAEQILWTQHLLWGYGAQPPLYTWLQWGVNQLFGPSVLSLSLLKHTLIVLAYALMWLAGRELLGRRGAWWAAGSLLLVPVFGWKGISDLTHTVLVTATTCGMWWLLLRIVRREGIDCQREFAALGLTLGCGMLAKYNFALAAGALLAALLSVPVPRRALFGRGWWWTLVVGLMIVAPHGAWLLSHWHLATVGTIGKMEIAQQPEWGRGLINLLGALLAMLGLWALAALAAFGSGWLRSCSLVAGNKETSPDAPVPPAWLYPVFARYLALIALALLAMLFVAGVTVFIDRWLLPLLLPVPLVAFALRPGLQAGSRGNRMTGLTLALALLILVAAGSQPWFAYVDGKAHPPNYPAAQLAQALQSAGYDGRGHIIAADHLLAGTLRTRFPAASVVACPPTMGDVTGCVAGSAQMAERAGQGWLVISHDDRTEPGWWAQALARVPDSDSLPRNNLRIPYRMVRPSQPLASYDFVWHPAVKNTTPRLHSLHWHGLLRSHSTCSFCAPWVT
jgi:4-amino-4-deoxy-L-arabinose transferase-like glycosyltransferase